jgi:hypothetical protein
VVESMEHWKLLVSLALKAKVALLVVIVEPSAGPLSIDAVGATESTVHVNDAGVPSVLPAASVALTWKVCEPWARLEYAWGLVQLVKVVVSSAHWKLEPVSLEVKLKLAEVEVLGFAGEELIDVSGGVVSTLTVKLRATVAPGLPAVSVALTRKVWAPFASAGYVCGLVQLVKTVVESIEHWKLLVSLALKPNEALLVVIVEPSAGPLSIDAVGATESTVQVKEAGVASVLLAASLALTWKVCEPWPSPV